MNWANVRRFQLATATLYAIATSAGVLVSSDFLTDEGAQQYHFLVGFLLIAWLTSDPLIPAAKRPSLDFGLFVWLTFPFRAADRLAFRARDFKLMTTLESFEQIGMRGFYRPTGSATFERGVDLVVNAMVVARESGCLDLLVNVYGLTGIQPPTVFARYDLAVKWARSAGPTLRVAMVSPAELIDHEKIGVLMAQNRGVIGDVFTNEAEAIAWLNGRQRGAGV